MTWSDIEKALVGCKLNPPASAAAIAAVGIPIPHDYAEVLAHANGLEGFVDPEQYLMLWSVDDLAELNAAYSVDEFLPGIVLTGTDGGDTGFGYDGARQQYVRTQLVGMEPSALDAMGGSFDEFVKALTLLLSKLTSYAAYAARELRS